MCHAVTVAAAGSEKHTSDREVADPGQHKPLAEARASEGEQGLRLQVRARVLVCPSPSKQDRTRTGIPGRDRVTQTERRGAVIPEKRQKQETFFQLVWPQKPELPGWRVWWVDLFFWLPCSPCLLPAPCSVLSPPRCTRTRREWLVCPLGRPIWPPRVSVVGRCYQAALAGNQERPRETCMEAQLNIVAPALESLGLGLTHVIICGLWPHHPSGGRRQTCAAVAGATSRSGPQSWDSVAAMVEIEQTETEHG